MFSHDKKACPKCGKDMECGMLLDRNYTSCRSQQWQGNCGGDGDEFSTLFDVTTFKCTDCGFLESYACDGNSKMDDDEEGPPIL
jgi:hypothetical protein